MVWYVKSKVLLLPLLIAIAGKQYDDKHIIMFQSDPAPVKPVRCEITPASIRAGASGGARANMPHFQVYAEIHSTVCPLDKPITGMVTFVSAFKNKLDNSLQTNKTPNELKDNLMLCDIHLPPTAAHLLSTNTYFILD